MCQVFDVSVRRRELWMDSMSSRVRAPRVRSSGRNLSMIRATTMASSEARWWLNFGRSSRFETMSSLKRFRSGSRSWLRARVSRNTGSKRRPWRRAVAFMKPVSKEALCATRGRPAAKAMKASSATFSSGAAATSASRMPVSSVISGGMGMPGFTKVLNSAMTSGPRNSTAPISVMRSVCAFRPVVSMSKAIYSVSRGRSERPCTAVLPSMSL